MIFFKFLILLFLIQKWEFFFPIYNNRKNINNIYNQNEQKQLNHFFKVIIYYIFVVNYEKE